MKTPEIDEQRESYDGIWEDLSHTNYRAQQHFKNRMFAISGFLSKLALDHPTILEVGCGFGVLSRELSRFGRVTGMDLSPKGVEIARRQNPDITFFHGDALNHDFGDDKYDIVVNSEVIEHIPRESRKRFINVLADRLNPGGYLILTTPNKAVSDHISTFQLIEEHFTRQELVELLEPRFDICELTTIHRVFPVLGHKSKLFQAIRAGLYEILRLRGIIENPFRASDAGLYFAVEARLKET